MRVSALVPDLMDRSKVQAAAQRAGAVVEFVADAPSLAGIAVDLVIVDLTRPGVLEVVPGLGPPVVGYGPHVDRGLLAAARQAGCDEVLARSAFFARLPRLLEAGTPQ